ncbi:ABC transporter ATP-binding protein [Agrococcus sp. Marseille-Q4369]|uniref:ABC transporter ATP-binding protein n=1 Tax=Agrococcus sp. Marseille-Q4369 TaxID=2810513 RepID=UPI001B8CE13D|nr:ABC transporter ATP-binding protein [Agrococcus sp. Marseille-Q4369]QUW18436.1 ABC transporter ATP-binding protein [Agrococcus sp. Marseille-Q4369]
MTTAPAVLADGLTKRYGARTVVDDVSFRIEPGETFALLGPNGAGKSTTVEMLEGFRTPTSGSASVLGVDPRHADRAWRSRIGVVLQSTGQADALTVREILTHFARLFPSARDVDETIAAVGLAEHAKRRVGKLSGGQQRRVDVALGIIGRPEVLFLDEPTTGFDPQARRAFWELIRDVAADGTTILLTTHYLDEAEQLADRAGIIARGRLLAIDRTDRIGGAEARTPIVRWSDASGHHEVRTHEPASVVRQLRGEPSDLEVVRPSLEDVYLSLIGDDADDQPEEAAA